jgi:hypothetical protein
MCPVSLSHFYFSDVDFVRAISRKFPDGRFLVFGASSREVEHQFAEAKREAFVVSSSDELTTTLGQSHVAAHFETAVWFYSSRENEDDRAAEALSSRAINIVLVAGPGTDAARRRPQLVQCLERFGLLPDYECDLMDLHPGALCLRHHPSPAVGALRPAAEAVFGRLNRTLGDLKRSLQIRTSELESARRQIAELEEKLLTLKEYRLELKSLKEQKQTLRKSPERRVGQILLAPYRLPEKLAKSVWKKLRRPNLSRERADFSLGK